MKTRRLDFESAVLEAAQQNLEMDNWNDPDEDHSQDCDIYLEEAEYLLRTTGENYYPCDEFNEAHPASPHAHIVTNIPTV